MNRREALHDIVVVGGGIVALTAAIAFARALPRATVSLVATKADPAALADRLPAVTPAVAEMFETLGLDEAALVAGGVATHRLGERFAWGEPAFTVGEGDGVANLAGAPPHQLWRAHGEGAFETLVPAAVLSQAERFAPPAEDRASLLSSLNYTLRLDPEALTPALLAAMRAARVRLIAPTSLSVERQAGQTIALLVDGGTRLTADLFIDASGPAALLAAEDAAWVDWRATLPVDRLLLAAAAARPSPLDRYEAGSHGWGARWPLARRTLVGFAYARETTNDARAAKELPGPAERIALHPRRQVAPFAGTVLAIGDAAAALGPLGWPGYTLALAQLELALSLMPARTPEPLLIAEFNRRATLRAERLHAYAAAFYLAGTARRGGFWHAARKAEPPAELATALAQFGQRGTLPPVEEEMVAPAQWWQALIGLGVSPQRRDPVALSVPRVSAIAAMTQLRTAIAALPAQLPPYPAWLAQAGGARSR